MATKWGILSSGQISHDFVAAIQLLPAEEHQVCSRSQWIFTVDVAASYLAPARNHFFKTKEWRIHDFLYEEKDVGPRDARFKFGFLKIK